MKSQHSRGTAGSSVVTLDWQPMVYVAGPYTMGYADNPLRVLQNIALGWEEAYRVWSACSARVSLVIPWADSKLVELDCQSPSWRDGYTRQFACEDYQRASLNALHRCDGAVFVGEWEHSQGSLQEWAYCWQDGIPRLDARDKDGGEIEAFVKSLEQTVVAR